MNSYWFAPRPKTVEHQHPFLVFDCQNHLHLPLTIFGKEASARVSPKTVQTYLYSITPFFTYLETDVWQIRSGNAWDAPPSQVRRSVEDYLVQKLQCQVHPHHQGWKYVAITAGTRSTIRVFLASLKMFYQVMRQCGSYTFSNPMIDAMSVTIAAVETHLERQNEASDPPLMPDQSGVGKPLSKPAHRLTDSYYKLEREEWVPQILDDPELPAQILKGGEKLPLKHTRMRDEVVTWLLFETGARISEVTGLMLGDWAALGTHTKARAFSKGSYGRRTKVLSFADNTVILLKRYFDEERIRFDPNGYVLEDYLLLAKRGHADLQTVPLFLTTQGTQLLPKEYREHYWNPACQAAEIEADVHQSRHWHVTCEVRDIYETAKSKAEIEQRLRGLVEYMKWQNEETLEVYQHYFNEQLDADTRDEFLKKTHQEVQRHLERRKSGKRGKYTLPEGKKQSEVAVVASHTVPPGDDEPDLTFLYSLAGGGVE
jgi:integrase